MHKSAFSPFCCSSVLIFVSRQFFLIAWVLILVTGLDQLLLVLVLVRRLRKLSQFTRFDILSAAVQLQVKMCPLWEHTHVRMHTNVSDVITLCVQVCFTYNLHNNFLLFLLCSAVSSHSCKSLSLWNFCFRKKNYWNFLKAS